MAELTSPKDSVRLFRRTLPQGRIVQADTAAALASTVRWTQRLQFKGRAEWSATRHMNDCPSCV